jgi:hypothetical protein
MEKRGSSMAVGYFKKPGDPQQAVNQPTKQLVIQ